MKDHLLLLVTVAAGYGTEQVREVGGRVMLLAGCGDPVVAGAAKWVLKADAAAFQPV